MKRTKKTKKPTIDGKELIALICGKLKQEDVMLYDSNIVREIKSLTCFELMTLIKSNQDENQPPLLGAVSGSLHYNENLLIDLWHKRNPCHAINLNSGEDMFWKTAFMVFEDYVREGLRNFTNNQK